MTQKECAWPDNTLTSNPVRTDQRFSYQLANATEQQNRLVFPCATNKKQSQQKKALPRTAQPWTPPDERTRHRVKLPPPPPPSPIISIGQEDRHVSPVPAASPTTSNSTNEHRSSDFFAAFATPARTKIKINTTKKTYVW